MRTEKLERLAANARPMVDEWGEDDWGSERQVNAEIALLNEVKRLGIPLEEHEFLKHTTDEMIDEILARAEALKVYIIHLHSSPYVMPVYSTPGRLRKRYGQDLANCAESLDQWQSAIEI